MIASDTVHAHQARCALHMARLWMLAGGPGGAPLRPCAVQQVIEATDAILAEVTASGRDLLPAADRGAAGSAPPSRGAPRGRPAVPPAVHRAACRLAALRRAVYRCWPRG